MLLSSSGYNHVIISSWNKWWLWVFSQQFVQNGVILNAYNRQQNRVFTTYVKIFEGHTAVGFQGDWFLATHIWEDKPAKCIPLMNRKA